MCSYVIEQLDIFREWFDDLRDTIAKAKIRVAIKKLEGGNFGNSKPITGGGGLSEVKIKHGPGYRLYFTIRERKIIIFLCGGDKDSQTRDIKLAKELLKEV